jgi:GT2 family glycosyltransferase
MRFAAAIVSWNGADYLPACLESVRAQEVTADIIVADNGSSDGSAELVRAFARKTDQGGVELLESKENEGFTRGANRLLRLLIERGAHDMIVLVNQDAQLLPGCLRSMAALAARDLRVAAIGAKILYPDGRTVQHAGGQIDHPRLVGTHHGHHRIDDGSFDVDAPVEYVTGAVMGLRAEALRSVGIFNEIFSPGYYEDVELCDRLRSAGWGVIYCASATAIHVESASFRDPLERLTLHHRNRLFYALPWLRDARFVERFVAAERAAFESEPVLDVLRAAASAYLEVIVRIDEAAAARWPPPPRPRLEREVVGILSALRDHCIEQLHRRRMKLSPTFFSEQ